MAWAAAGGTWTFVSDSARAATVAWAASTGKCKGAITHALYHVSTVCGGYAEEAPAQFTPGFGPLALAWGWLLIGVMLGVLLALNFWDLVARLEQFAQLIDRVRLAVGAAPPGLHAMPLWHAAVRTALYAAEGPRRTVLQRLADDGDAALDLLAAGRGVSRRAALEHVLGVQTVQINAVAWRL